MASFNFDRADRKAVIQFWDGSRRRRTIRLSDVSRTFAERFHEKVEKLNTAKRTSSGIDNHLADWLSELSDVFYDKLVRVDLVEPRLNNQPLPGDTEPEAPASITLGPFLDDYIARRTDLKGTSLSVYEHVKRNLVAYFKRSRKLSEITSGDCVDFGRYLAGQKLSRTTIDRRMSLATTIFGDAVRHQHIESNPFTGWRKPLKNLTSRTNKSRQRFINRKDFAKILDKAPNAEWRLLLALSRFGGLRVPSEPLSLKWEHVDFEHDRIKVPCPKLEHHEGREFREIPIFSELRPYLVECWELAEPGVEWVIARHRPKSVRNGDGFRGANLRTTLRKIITRAGLEVPPKAWNNMRASRATELAEQFPGHVAAAWLGHTEEIANAHYRQVLPEHFEKASSGITESGVMPQALPHGDDSGRVEPQGEDEPNWGSGRNSLRRKEKRPHAETCDRFKVEAGGIEPPSCCPSV